MKRKRSGTFRGRSASKCLRDTCVSCRTPTCEWQQYLGRRYKTIRLRICLDFGSRTVRRTTEERVSEYRPFAVNVSAACILRVEIC